MPDYGYRYRPNDGHENREAANDIIRVQRSGAFGNLLGGVRCASRYGGYPLGASGLIGFRVVMHPAS